VHCLPKLVHFTMSQIWSTSLWPDVVYFSTTRCVLLHYDQMWSISLWARSGLLHYDHKKLKLQQSHTNPTAGTTIYCSHEVCYGFEVLRRCESPWHPFCSVSFTHSLKASSSDYLWQCMPSAQLLSQQRASTLPEYSFSHRSFPLVWSQGCSGPHVIR